MVVLHINDYAAMTDIEKSNFIMLNFPAGISSTSRRRPIAGFGINDASYITQAMIGSSKVICPAYRCWKGMVSRVFGECELKRFPKYKHASICNEWRRFSIFREWWEKNQVDGFHIDKDIVSDKKIYSESTCIFIPHWINTFTLDSGLSRGQLPIGVTFNLKVGKYQAQCLHPFLKRNRHVGYFDSSNDAYNAWLKRKLEIALELKPKMDEIDERIYHGVVRIINNAT